MIDKRVASAGEAVADVRDGATVMIGGFGEAGSPIELIHALIDQGAKGLTVISNNTGTGLVGLAALLRAGRVRKVICSFPKTAGSTVFPDLYRAGKVELELVPQGTLAERIRAGGAGVAAFYTPTAYGTELAAGKEVREFDGRHYVMERAIRGDVALVHAATGDRWGNLTYAMTARNFNPVMATAARSTLAEVRHFVDVVPPELVVTPGIFVHRMLEVGA